MKRFLTLFTIIGLGWGYAAAQPESGYYRVHSGINNHYVTIVTDKIDQTNYDAVKRGGGGSVYALRFKKLEEVISDPGSIIKINKQSEGYVLEGQGMNTKTLTTLYLQMRNRVGSETAPEGAWWLYGTQSGTTRYLFDSKGKYDTEVNSEGKLMDYTYLYCVGNQTSGNYMISNPCSRWYFEPIDNSKQYFGITPESDITVDGKYYTTVYCGFPFELGAGMKAYYVTGLEADNPDAITREIEDGIVPANTPVIIECSSLDAADNKVTVSAEVDAKAANKMYSNSLKGVHFSYVMRDPVDGLTENTDMSELKHAQPYYANSMRVLGLSSDGKLALVKATDKKLNCTKTNKYIRANTAYVQMSGLLETVYLSADGTAGISNVKTENAQSGDIFNLQGQKVATKGTSIDELPNGLYIVNGRKVIKK